MHIDGAPERLGRVVADRRFWLGVAAYVGPSFPLAYVWHLVLFAGHYDALQIYRDDVIVPFGFTAMILQGIAFSWIYRTGFAGRAVSWLGSGLTFALFAGLLSWTFTTLSVAAKTPMTSVPGFVAIETAFTVVQFLLVGTAMGLAYRTAAARAT